MELPILSLHSTPASICLEAYLEALCLRPSDLHAQTVGHIFSQVCMSAHLTEVLMLEWVKLCGFRQTCSDKAYRHGEQSPVRQGWNVRKGRNEMDAQNGGEAGNDIWYVTECVLWDGKMKAAIKNRREINSGLYQCICGCLTSILCMCDHKSSSSHT